MSLFLHTIPPAGRQNPGKIPANTKKGGLFMINLESLSLQEKIFNCLLLLKGGEAVCEYVLFAVKTPSMAVTVSAIRLSDGKK